MGRVWLEEIVVLRSTIWSSQVSEMSVVMKNDSSDGKENQVVKRKLRLL